MTNGATTLVNPSSERVLRSATKNPLMASTSGKEEHLHDVALVEAEERLMDEEITSIEDNHEEMSSVEHNMVNAALEESSHGALMNHVQDDDEKKDFSDHMDDGIEGRYGLRKRRRPTGHDLERLEHFQSSKDGGLMRSNLASLPPLSSTENIGHDDSVSEGLKHRGVEMAEIKSSPQLAPTEISLSQGSPNQQSSMGSAASAPMQRTMQNETFTTEVAASRASCSKNKPVSLTSVPNPLLHIADVESHHPCKAAPTVSPSLLSPVPKFSLTVPCPLPGLPVEDGITDMAPAPSSASTFPEKVKQMEQNTPALRPTSITMPASLPTSNVTFSLADLDDGDKGRKVTIIDQPLHMGSRIRGFSIDMDLGLDFADLGGSSQNNSVDGRSGRDRAFSFECFAFGINADEPLPPLEHQLSMMQGRPRGDSLIFDPASFQDGGIHEKNALETPLGPTPHMELVPPKAVRPQPQPQPVPSKPPAKLPTEVPPVPSTVIMQPTRVITTEQGNSAPVLLVSPGSSSLSLDLVNKDGRIGIYLPEARRARIARFHAKRAKRIWRKRIKYDCRKKLADSRPRIKGRFVKRTDMDDE